MWANSSQDMQKELATRNSLGSILVDYVLYGAGIRFGSDFTEDFRSQDLDNCSSGIVFRFLCPGLRFLVQGPGFWGARLAECPGSLRAESGVSQESPDPGGVSLESFYALGHAARLSECPRSLRKTPSLQGVSGAQIGRAHV